MTPRRHRQLAALVAGLAPRDREVLLSVVPESERAAIALLASQCRVRFPFIDQCTETAASLVLSDGSSLVADGRFRAVPNQAADRLEPWLSDPIKKLLASPGEDENRAGALRAFLKTALTVRDDRPHSGVLS